MNLERYNNNKHYGINIMLLQIKSICTKNSMKDSTTLNEIYECKFTRFGKLKLTFFSVKETDEYRFIRGGIFYDLVGVCSEIDRDETKTLSKKS